MDPATALENWRQLINTHSNGINGVDERDESQPLNVNPSSGILEGTSKDVLVELYWYIIKDQDVAVHDLTIGCVVETLKEEGLLFWRDDRFKESQDAALRFSTIPRSLYNDRISTEAQDAANAIPIDYSMFQQLVTPTAGLFLKALSEELIIPDWSTFVADMTYHFQTVESITDGTNASYIPVLRDADPDKWGLSICSIDGQRYSIGDHSAPFSLQSVSKPITYALGMTREGQTFMSDWIGSEPAGRPFNTQDLDTNSNCPFNSNVNSGAIMAAGIIASGYPEHTWKEVVDKVRVTWHDLCGDDSEVGFSMETFESERDSAYNNFAIAYNLKGRRGLPRNIDLHTMLDVYLGCCSIEMTTDALSVAAATLANGGVCPITRKEVFPAQVTRTVLSEIMTCGMYDQAGRFAVDVGLPSKSGVSGALMVIVPSLMGMALFSPRLNSNGNSVRGIEFCKRLVSSYRVHVFEPLRSGITGAKVDPRKNGWKNERHKISEMAWAVEVGDQYAIRQRDIFLFALCQTAVASTEGLSDRMMRVIHENYEMVYQIPVNDTLLNQVVAVLQRNPSDMRILENLTKDVVLIDSLRSSIILAMIDIIMIDRRVDDAERNMVIRIAVLLGIDQEVAKMEISRYEQISHDGHLVGHRFKNFEFCQMIDILDADVSMRRAQSPREFVGGLSSSRHGTGLYINLNAQNISTEDLESVDSTVDNDASNHGENGIVNIQAKEVKQGSQKADSMQLASKGDIAEENAALRKELAILRRKLHTIEMLLSGVNAHHDFEIDV